MKEQLLKYIFCFCVALVLYQTSMADTNNFLTLPDDNILYYDDQGHGDPIIFIPGWTATHHFFDKQIAYFKQNYRVIAIDPRGQGLSSAGLLNNDYTQHGKDLDALIKALKLKNVTLVSWSWGCYDAYAYVRQYDTNNIKAFVCVDAAPKAYGEKEDWQATLSQVDIASIIQQVQHDRSRFVTAWIPSMLEAPLSKEQLTLFSHEVMRTPPYVSLLLMFDALNSDYSPEAILLDKNKIPVLDFVSLASKEKATIWLNKNASHAKIVYMGKHMLFWDHATEFNQILDEFIKNKNTLDQANT
jgi:non-heme chloroperoxidase